MAPSNRPHVLRIVLGVGGLALLVTAGYWLFNEVVFHKPNPSAFVAIPTLSRPTAGPSGPATTLGPGPGPSTTAGASLPAEVVSNKVGLVAWKPESSEFVHFLIVQELTNVSERWMEIDAFDSTYELFRPDGSVLTTSNFLYAYPRYLAPGQTGYVIEDGLEEGITETDVDRVEVSATYQGAIGAPAQLLEVSNTSVRPQSFGDGLVVTGQAKNVGTAPIEDAHVGAIFFDDDGQIVGAATTNLLENVAPGEMKAFETLASNPLTEADYAEYVVIGSSTF
jgi:hypothetical protein